MILLNEGKTTMAKASQWNVQDAMKFVFTSPNVEDRNGEPANVVDVIHQVAHGLFSGSTRLNSLVEATNNVAAGLHAIAEAIKSTSKSTDNE